MIKWDNLENEVINDRYEIKKLIGEGGAGKVFLAYDKKKERNVALKTSNPNQTMSNYKKRFYMEAKVLSSLKHKNIVDFYEYIKVDDINIIVMEYVEGKTLKEKIDKKDYISREQSLKYIKQILSALNEVHSHKVYHRDIKTDNIHITVDDNVKLLDFGIIQFDEDQNLTRQGSVIGTISYLAPEIILNTHKKANEKTDIYSLGILFYQLLTGIKPFKENREIENASERNNDLASKIVYKPVVSPKDIDATISQELNHLVMKMIEREPSDRYQTTEDVLKDLNSLNSGKPISEMQGYYEDESEEHSEKSMKKQIIILTTIISIVLLVLIAVAIFLVIHH